MSNIERELDKVVIEMREAQARFERASAYLQTQLTALVAIGTDDAKDTRLRAIKALTIGTRNYGAGLLAIADQMVEEIKEIS